jgi:cobalamin synthase
MMGVVARSVPYAHEDGGTATAFLGQGNRASLYGVAAYGIGAAVAFAAVGAGSRGFVVVAAELVAILAVAFFSVRRVGGYTGDVLGAMGVIGETVGLLALAAR